MEARVYVATPPELWLMALTRYRDELPADLAKYLALGVASQQREYVELWSRRAAVLEDVFGRHGIETLRFEARNAAYNWQLAAMYAADEGNNCFVCLAGVLQSFALTYLYAVAMANGLRPVVHEGEYAGFYYVAVAASEAGLQEAVKAVEEHIEAVCKSGARCRR